ncbi:multidrug efflux system protein, EmrE family [Campylobacter iguaniorum]|uniref:Multidrug efflux system protein, EmrE family n=1 Tax=Campylobacter iguaniorum TaxID=1244531 RepID=A0A076FAY6_9BACT|nr:SMR family transporter [Campylobacter iguaniorum]AII15171.1 multidrug efflux system protein, EmrE family [Campylobacter iguaniorum]ALV25096.1 multidrug efflux system protein, EmrE family [Campylobacter iguaniorum]
MSNKGFVFVIIGAIVECGWAYGLKHANSNLEYGITALLVCASFFIFMQAFKYLPASVAYTLFVGFGAFFIVLAEMATDYYNGNEINLLRVFFIATLLAGVFGLKRLEK